MRLGIHTSIGGGFEKAVKHLVDLNCNACQMFSRSPRGGKARVLGEKEVETFRALCEKNDIDPVAVHIPYVLNLATSDPAMHEYAVSMVKEDLERANLLGASYLVLHMGSHRGEGIETGLSQVAKALEHSLEGYDGNTTVLLENTSGAGKEVGFTFEHLKWVLDQLKTPKAGICFDTCHGFAAGYDLTSGEKVKETFEKLDDLVGISNLKLIHANDSMYPIGSTKDRHAHIGQGYIGEDGFKAILRHPKLKKIPFILETPIDEKGGWAENISAMRRLAEQ